MYKNRHFFLFKEFHFELLYPWYYLLCISVIIHLKTHSNLCFGGLHVVNKTSFFCPASHYNIKRLDCKYIYSTSIIMLWSCIALILSQPELWTLILGLQKEILLIYVKEFFIYQSWNGLKKYPMGIFGQRANPNLNFNILWFGFISLQKGQTGIKFEIVMKFCEKFLLALVIYHPRLGNILFWQIHLSMSHNTNLSRRTTKYRATYKQQN